MSFYRGWVITVAASWLCATPSEPRASSVAAPADYSAVAEVSAQVVLSSVREASGGSAWNGVQQIDARGITDVGGLSGEMSSSHSLIDARSFEHIDLGAIERTSGHDGVLPWSLDPSGLVDVFASKRALAKSITANFVSSSAYLRPLSGELHASVHAEQRAARTFQVVSLTPLGGEPLELWVDARTHLIARVVFPMEQQAQEWSDYRRVHQLLLPHRLVAVDEAHNEQTTRITSYQLHSDVDAPRFQRPTSRARDTKLLQPISIPAAVQEGLVAIRVAVNGSAPLPFILDTGTGINVLTPAAASRLGIKSAGHFNSTAGREAPVQASVAKVSHLQIGEAAMTNQSFVVVPWSLPTIVIEGQREPVAGLLGYDFFRRFVVGIDYDAQRVSLAPLQSCSGESSTAAKLYLDESRIPQVEATLEGVTGLWTLDIGNAGAASSALPVFERQALGASVLKITSQNSEALVSPPLADTLGYRQLKQLAPTFDYECRTLSVRART